MSLFIGNSSSNSQGTTVPSRFEEACAKIEEANRKFLDSQALILSDEEDEEDDIPNNSSAFTSLIDKYSSMSLRDLIAVFIMI